MTSEEKAQELVDKFYDKIEDMPIQCGMYCLGGTIDRKLLAKKCALIAVGEILQDGMLEKAPFMSNGKDLMKGNFVRYKDYWQQVKTEIEAL
jgi:hypothetical protein